MTDDYLTDLLGIRLTGGVEVDADVAFDQFPANTLVVGQSQVTMVEVPGHPDELYFFNFITRPGSRGMGEARELLDRLLDMADEHQVTLCTHPDQPWMAERLIANRGFQVDEERPAWDGKPFMFRRPSSRPASSVEG